MLRIRLLLAAILLGQTCLWGGVRHIQVPENGISPDVVVGPSGEVYLVFARDRDALFAVSKDDGASFSSPIRLNPVAESVLAGHERGPKIALGKNATVHVVWMSTKSEQLFYTRSEPGARDLAARDFSAPRNLLDAQTHLDGATVAADQRGNVLVAWLDARLPEDKQDPISLPIFWTESRDDGRTFSKNQPADTPQWLRACSCCALKAAAANGVFYLGFRGAYNNIRDMFLAALRSSVARPDIVAVKIHDDEWHFEGCPMSGPSLAPATASGELWSAWMSRGDAYYAASDDDGRHFRKPLTTRSAKEGAQNHPLVLVNAQGHVFLAWEEGRDIRWQITDRSGRLLDSGDAGTLPENSKATGYVDRRADLCLVF